LLRKERVLQENGTEEGKKPYRTTHEHETSTEGESSARKKKKSDEKKLQRKPEEVGDTPLKGIYLRRRGKTPKGELRKKGLKRGQPHSPGLILEERANSFLKTKTRSTIGENLSPIHEQKDDRGKGEGSLRKTAGYRGPTGKKPELDNPKKGGIACCDPEGV